MDRSRAGINRRSPQRLRPMRYSSVLACVLCLCLWAQVAEGAGGCEQIVVLDSNQQWELFEHQYVRLRGGNGFLAAPAEGVQQRVQLLDSNKDKRTQWFFRDGMLWSRRRPEQVLTVNGRFLALRKRGVPPLPTQLFRYANGTLRNRGTGRFLTGWEETPRITMEPEGEGCKQTPVVHLLNEQWQLDGSHIRSLWNGAVLTRKDGQAYVTTLPLNTADKSLHQRWYWQHGYLRESKWSVIKVKSNGEIVAGRPQNRPDQMFSLFEGYLVSEKTGKVLYIPKSGVGLHVRRKHDYV